MFKKFFIASLLLVITTTTNATPIKGITGQFDIFAVADITLNAAGEISLIDFDFATVAVVQPGDYIDYLFGGQALTLDTNPINISSIVGLQLWNVNGFAFTATEVISNQTRGSFTSLSIVGDVTHENFITTSTNFFISAQGLNVDSIKTSGLSATVTSPIPEPSTLAIFALSLIGFAASRKKKSA